LFKTSKGKYVAPAPFEYHFIAIHLIEMAVVSGRAQPQPHAIIQLSEGSKEEAAEGEARRTKLGKELEALLKSVNPKLDGD
jgi:long-chain acyl-CoA synthetase